MKRFIFQAEVETDEQINAFLNSAKAQLGRDNIRCLSAEWMAAVNENPDIDVPIANQEITEGPSD